MYYIEITERARDQADAVYEWLLENVSLTYAEKWYQELFQRLEKLTHYPARCPIASESPRFPYEIRELAYGKSSHKYTYRIIFTIQKNKVSILNIYHSARKELKPH